MMTRVSPVPTPHIDTALPTRERLIIAGEYLIAEHGVAGVSLQEVCGLAGTSNRSAVQYHFGGKEGLVRSILEYRLPQINSRRDELLAESGNDLHALVFALVLPLAENVEYGNTNYVGFLRKITMAGRAQEQYRELDPRISGSALECLERIGALLAPLPVPIANQRIRTLLTIFPAVLERRSVELPRGAAASFEFFVSDLLDSLVHMLSAPVSERTRRHIPH
jgi:AcrR family transcriptional regulator